MFRRNRTTPTRDISTVALAFHGRLAAMLAGPVTERPVDDRRAARDRLAGPARAGLLDRIEGRVTA